MFILYYLFMFMMILIILTGNFVTTKSYIKVMINKPFTIFKDFFDFSKLPLKRKKDKIIFFVPSILFFILVMGLFSMCIYFATFIELGNIHIYIILAFAFLYVVCFLVMNWFIYKEVLKIKLFSDTEYKELINNFFE